MVFEYRSNTSYQEIADRLRRAKRIAIFAHERPDGDALGSQLALARSMTAHGIDHEIFAMGPIEPALLTIAHDTPITRIEESTPGDDFDQVMIVDTGAWSQIRPIEDWIRERHDVTTVLDHHPRGDDVARWRLIDSTAAASAVLIVELLDVLDWEVDGEVAEALFAALATDTGWFRYANADVRAFQIAARLLETGVNKSMLYTTIEETYRPARLDLAARALASVEYLRKGTIAVQHLTLDDFEETGCSVNDLTGLVNQPMIVQGVRASILLSETDPRKTKLSFRAKPKFDGEAPINVNELAHQFGGGGHVFAAGARIDKPIEEALAELRGTLA